MILAYRYIRDKRRKAKAAREAQEQGLTSPPSRTASDDAQTVQGQVPSPGAPTTPSSVLSSTLKWRILLMVALLVPVLFETLDYTGGYCPFCNDPCHSLRECSCRHRTSRDRRTSSVCIFEQPILSMKCSPPSTGLIYKGEVTVSL